jgi:hypothetical protein
VYIKSGKECCHLKITGRCQQFEVKTLKQGVHDFKEDRS